MFLKMDWYFDIAVLVGTFFVIAIGMTIYARLTPIRPRVGHLNYIYTGIIPTITISSADSPTKRSPTTPADSIEEDEHKSSNSESPVDDAERARQLKYAQNNHLSVPDLDDEDDEEEQQQSDQSEDISAPISLVDNADENKDKSQVGSLTSSPVEDIVKDENSSEAVSLSATSIENVVGPDKDNSQDISLAAALDEDVQENEQQPKTALLLFDKSDDEDHSQTASLSALDCLEDDYSENMDSSELPDDLNLSPVLSKNDRSSETDASETPPSTPFTNSFIANNGLCKIGTSHTVEEPLFPFSDIFEENNPSARNRFKKRLSH